MQKTIIMSILTLIIFSPFNFIARDNNAIEAGQNQCKKVQIAGKAPCYSTRVFGGENSVNLLRTVRDEILAGSPEGKGYIKLFYDVFPDFVLIMMRNPDIRAQASSAATQIASLSGSALSNNQISPEIGEILNTLLDKIVNAEDVSEGLRDKIQGMRQEMPIDAFITGFNNGDYNRLSGGGVKRETPHADKYNKEYILVKFKAGTHESRISEICGNIGGAIDRHYKEINVYKIRIPHDKVMEKIEALSEYEEVEYAEPDYTVTISQTFPNDAAFSNLWGMHNTGQTGGNADVDIDAPEAWNITTGIASVVVAVIDSGVDLDHEDLAQNIWVNAAEVPGNSIDDDGNGYVDDINGWDFVNGDNDPMDDNDHGSHVSGTIGGVGNNATGVTGVNWTVSIMALKFLDSCGSGSTSGAIDAIIYSANMRAHISNNSWGGGGYSQALYDAIEYYRSTGGVFIVASGNEGLDNDQTPSYPSSFDNPNIISVASLNSLGNLSSFSNYGATSVDVAAPGEAIYSCVVDGYAWFDGTSMAAPHVAGIAGLIKAIHPDWDYDYIKQLLLYAVDTYPSLTGKVLTGGMTNARAAVNYAP